MVVLEMTSEIIAAIIGAGAVALSVSVVELLRRKQRPEIFASAVFNRRLETYEGLWKMIEAGKQLTDEALRPDKEQSEVHALISAAVLAVANYTDENAFFLDEELTVHCCTLFMGAEDVPKMEDADKAKWHEFQAARYRETRRMVLETSGVTAINRVFRDVYDPRLDSLVIRYFRSEVRKQRKVDSKRASTPRRKL